METAIRAACEAILHDLALADRLEPLLDDHVGTLPINVRSTCYRKGVVVKSATALSIDALLEPLPCDTAPLVVVEAPPGGGKSLQLTRTMRRLVDAVIRQDNLAPIPVFIRLNEYRTELSRQSLSDLIRGKLTESSPIDYRALSSMASPRVVALDSLDAVSEIGDVSAWFRQLATLARTGEFRFLLASRPDPRLMRSVYMIEDVVWIQLNGIDPRAAIDYLERHLRPDALARFGRITGCGATAERLVRVPLVFRILASASHMQKSEDAFNVYPGRSGVLHGLIWYLMHHAILEERIPSTSDFYAVAAPLEKACFEASCKGLRDTLPFHLVPGWLQRGRDKSTGTARLSIEFEWARARDIALASGLVWGNEARSEYAFVHQQIAELLASRELARRLIAAEGTGTFELAVCEMLERSSLDDTIAFALAQLSVDPEASFLVPRALDCANRMLPSPAIDLCARLDGPLAASWLKAAASDRGARVRRAAITALGQLTDPRGLAALIELADHLPRKLYVQELTAAIASNKSPLAVEALCNIATGHRHHPGLRADALTRVRLLNESQAVAVARACRGNQGTTPAVRVLVGDELPTDVLSRGLEQLAGIAEDQTVDENTRCRSMYALVKHAYQHTTLIVHTLAREEPCCEPVLHQMLSALETSAEAFAVPILTEVISIQRLPDTIRCDAILVMRYRGWQPLPQRLRDVCAAVRSSPEVCADLLRLCNESAEANIQSLARAVINEHGVQEQVCLAALRARTWESESEHDTDLRAIVSDSHQHTAVRALALAMMPATQEHDHREYLIMLLDKPDVPPSLKVVALSKLDGLSPAIFRERARALMSDEKASAELRCLAIRRGVVEAREELQDIAANKRLPTILRFTAYLRLWPNTIPDHEVVILSLIHI